MICKNIRYRIKYWMSNWIGTLSDFFQQILMKLDTPTGKRGLLIANMLAGMLLIGIIAQQFIPILTHHQTTQNDDAGTAPIIQSITPKTLSRQISNQHLFGRAPALTVPTEIVTNIKVLGIFLAEDPKLSSVVLMVDEAPEQNYWPGDKLRSGGEVKEIKADHVIIVENGTRKMVRFDMNEFSGNQTVPASRQVSADDRSKPPTREFSNWRERFRDRLRESQRNGAFNDE